MGLSLSFSAAQRYLLSPFSWYAHYLLRIRPVAQGSALAFGGALDTGFNSLLIDMMEGREPDLGKAKAAFCLAFTTQDINGETRYLHEAGVLQFSKADLDESLLTQDDHSSGLNKSWLSLYRKGQIMIDEYYEQVLPKIEKVLLVQHEISMTNADGDKFIGVVDFVAQINGKIWVVDNKSTSIKYKEDSADNSGQLATYFEALRDDYDLAGVCYLTVSKKVLKRKKPQINIEFIFGTISEELIESTFQDYDSVLTGIKTGQFQCTRNEPGGCGSLPWKCSYKTMCCSAGKDMTGLVYNESKKR